MPNDISEIEFKQRLIKLFKEFIDICNKNKLRYYAAYGTALGAVRHRGIIPWDDDIDVWMPREDYERFLSLRNQLTATPYEILDIQNKGYYLYFAKFCDKNTTLIEREGEPIIGLYIDIFPLDNYDPSKKWLKQVNSLYRYAWLTYGHSYRNYSWKEVKGALYQSRWGRLGIMIVDTTLLKILRHPSKLFITYINNVLKTTPKSEKIWMYSIISSECKIYPKKWFGEGIEMPFENFSVTLPSGYNQILSTEYGDYMTPPPIEKRPSHHFRYFVNLKKRLTLKEVKENL